MSTKVRKIITVIIGILIASLFVVGAFIVIRLSQEAQNNQGPQTSYAAWCTGAEQCPAGWNWSGPNNPACGSTGLGDCTQGGSGGGGGGGSCKCDGFADPGTTHCNTSLNRRYTCSSTCQWIDTGLNCQGGTVNPPPTTQCGDARCEGNENGTNCYADCGTDGAGGGGGGGATNVCSGAGNNPSCTQVGQVVTYGTNQTCICSRTSGTLCGCVPTSGSVCQLQEDGCTTMGASCRDSTSTSGTPTNRVGTCISNGMVGGQLKCSCNPAPDTGQGPSRCGDGACIAEEASSSSPAYCPADCGGATGQCSLDSDCTSGKFCSNGTCATKSSNGGGCAANNQCLSGNCVISGGTGICQSAGTGGNACSPSGSLCSNPAGGGSNGYCNGGNCTPRGAVNASCVNDLACQSGLLCMSLRCRQPVDDSNPAASCTSGQWYCYGSPGMTGGAPGQGQICNNGALSGTWTTADACASTSGQNPSQGMSCAGLRRLSGGEALNGMFVGCSGRLNCFCGALDSAHTVNCIPDVGNDSCGASGDEPVPVIPGGTPPPPPGSTPPPTTPPPPPPGVPYCGDGLCATGEACESTTPDGTSYAACQSANGSAPTGTAVSACYGIELKQPDTTSTCQYCGDGVFTPGREQCDSTAPAGNGNNPTACNANCTLQQTASQCIDLVENGVDPIRSGTGNYIIYTLVYQNPSTSNPYPSIRLRVGPSGTPVGRDAFATGSALVAPIPGAQGYSFDAVTSRHTFRFRWEAASTGGSPVADGTYDVRVLTDGTSTEITSPVACIESLQVQSSAQQQPLFNIVKAGAPVCVDDGSVQINYTLTVTNIGPVQGVIDFVRDTVDTNVVAAGISPTNITPSFGAFATGVITWTGTVSDRTFTAGQSKQYTYRITIPTNLVASFSGAGVLNQALVQFDTATTTDNTDSFDVRTLLECVEGATTVPDTGLFDDGRFLLIGIVLAIGGVVVYKVDFTRKIKRPLSGK